MELAMLLGQCNLNIHNIRKHHNNAAIHNSNILTIKEEILIAKNGSL
jgi:hypothetical protein